MKITPTNKQKISHGPAKSSNELPRKGPGPAAARKGGMHPSMATEDKNSKARGR